jgi:hypothetical protein
MIARLVTAFAAAAALVATATPASAVNGCSARSTGASGAGSCTFPAWRGTYVLDVTTTANRAASLVTCDLGDETSVSTEVGHNVAFVPLAGGTCTLTVVVYGDSPVAEAVGHVQWVSPE